MTWSKPISDWARDTFGASTPERALERAQEEWDELKLKPSAEEAADVVICLTAYVRTLGSDMAAEVERKMEINRAREWVTDGTGCGYHKKGPAMTRMGPDRREPWIKSAGPVQVRETKRAFYAGAHVMLGLAVEVGDLEENAAVDALSAIDAEIGEFVASIGGERE